MTTDDPTALAKLSPVSTASYLASLLAIGNWSWMVHSVTSSSKDCRTTPIPPACLLDDSFNCHGEGLHLPLQGVRQVFGLLVDGSHRSSGPCNSLS